MMKRALLAGSAVLVAGVVTAAAIGIGGGGQAGSSNADVPSRTEPVTRNTLAQTQQVNGVLGYGTPVTVNARLQGTITWLPKLGATIRRGQPLYKVDDHAVSLFYGALALYRPLQTGSKGNDVREVEANLAALGYTGFTVDNHFTSSTAAAVRRWQKQLGLTQTGEFDPARVAIAPNAIRVTSVAAHSGDSAGGPVLAYTGSTRAVSVALDVALQDLAKVGQAAQVTLPNATTVEGRIAAVGTVATAGQDAQHPATIDVTVTVADQSKLGTLDQAPVVVRLTSQTVENALTVPVAALVALAEGGYGVEVVTGSTSRYVVVELGMFADGRVQITGDGIAEGTRVTVPS
jgi:peptidoglycan hydrolase-like protein with peptidoglycan-binding domain